MLGCEKRITIYLLVIEPQSICMALFSQYNGRKRLLIWERNVTKIFWDQMLGETCRERNENIVLLWRGLKSVSVQEILSGKILPLLCKAVLQRLPPLPDECTGELSS